MTRTITHCPACDTGFRITEAQLLEAEGSVRCGACGHVFQAEDYLAAPLLDKTEMLAIRDAYFADFESWVTGSDATTATAGHRVYESEDVLSEFPVGRLYEVEGAPMNLKGISLPHEDPALLVRDHRRMVSAWSLKWLPPALLMLFIGYGQYVFFNMSVYAQRPEYRRYYLEFCRYAACDVPEYDDTEALKTRELSIRSHPSRPDALMVEALLLNDADFRQAFPGLRLRFFGMDGRLVAGRTFKVHEYLGGELRGLRFIPARTEVRISLELFDPGEEAGGYEMTTVHL